VVEISVRNLRDNAQRVLDVAELAEVALQGAEFKAHETDPIETLETKVELNVHSGRNENWVLARCEYSVEATEVGNSANVAWTAKIECIAYYECKSPSQFTSEELQSFALIVGAPTLHPFARSHLQMLTALSRYPAYTLGLLKPLSALPDEHVISIDNLDEEG
jgi:hypothetical protein